MHDATLGAESTQSQATADTEPAQAGQGTAPQTTPGDTNQQGSTSETASLDTQSEQPGIDTEEWPAHFATTPQEPTDRMQVIGGENIASQPPEFPQAPSTSLTMEAGISQIAPGITEATPPESELVPPPQWPAAESASILSAPAVEAGWQPIPADSSPDTNLLSPASQSQPTSQDPPAEGDDESDLAPMSELDAAPPETLEAMREGPSWGDNPNWVDDFNIPERPRTAATQATPWIEPIQSVTDVVGDVQATGLRQRKPKTEEDYLRRVKFLMRKSSEMRTLDPEQPHVPTPLDVVEDLLHLAPRYTIHTWLLYRSALLWYLASNLNRHSEQANNIFSMAYKRLASTRAKPGARDPRTRIQTAATNMRGIPEADFVTLLQELSTNRRKAANWSSRVSIYLQAILAAGLRPGEWCTATWQDDTKSALQVVTLKTKETMAHLDGTALYEPDGVHPRPPNPDASPRIRTVPVDPEDRLMVDLHLENIRGYLLGVEPGDATAKRYKTYYEYCRRALDRVCRRLWAGKKSYSLYDGRHQFAANRKAEMSLEDVAKLLGHESTRSTVIYASKVKAWSRKRGETT